MRNAFASEITALAAQDERLVLLSGDIGNRLFDEFKERCPDRFFNCGIAEANMTGMAAGLALCGMRPITYTITPFAVTRCLEQIKVDVCYQNLPVIIVGTGSGLSYAGLGATHHSLEDIATLRSMPNLTVVCPADTSEVRLAIRAAMKLPGPVYIRLGKKGEPLVHQSEPEFTIGKGIVLREGKDICILGCGNMLPVAVQAADLLENQSISTRVVSIHTVKPLDEVLLAETFTNFRLVVTIEEHSLKGGFSSSVAEWLADQPSQTSRLLRFGTPDRYLHEGGNQNHARQVFGLTGEDIVAKVLQVYVA
jgi:transketolase